MSTDAQQTIAKRVARLKTGVVVAVLWTIATVLAHGTKWGEALDYSVATRLEFAARERFDAAPTVDPRLKIFGYDDAAVADFQRPEISLADWSTLFTAISKQKPKAVFVDKMFTLIPPGETAATAKLKETLKAAGPVNVGSFIHNSLIPFRETLPLTRDDFSLNTMTEARLAEADWLPKRSSNVYGPHKSILDGFAHVGHLLTEPFGRVTPVFRVNDNTAIPHLALYAGRKLQVHRGGLRLGDTDVPLDRNGRILVNYPTRESLYHATYSLQPAIKRARAGERLPQIDEGDVVLILPLLYTGNVDIADDTPIG